MWLKIIQAVVLVAQTTGAKDWAEAWLKAKLQGILDKAKKKAEAAIAVADKHDIKGVYGITVNRKRTAKEILDDMVKRPGSVA